MAKTGREYRQRMKGDTRLVIDIGNSRSKCGLFVHGRLLRRIMLTGSDVAAVRSFLSGGTPACIVVGSVARPDPAFLNELRAIAPVTEVTGDTPGPIRSLYRTRGTLGTDRWANAVGASLLLPDRPALAISLGTCVTYDLVSRGVHLGGLISPGFRMRARAMSEFTARLPLVDPPMEPPFIGTSTEESLASGTHHGLLAELAHNITLFRHQHPGLAVVLTGGDALRFARALESGIFAHPFLTLLGLHALSLSDHPVPGTDSGGRP